MITIREARQTLFEVFAENKSGKPKTWLRALGVTKIYDHEPFGGLLLTPASITIRTGQVLEDEIVLELRVYVDASGDAQKSNDLLDLIIDTIEFGNNNLSYISSRFSQGQWETSFEEEISVWGAINRLSIGREDF